RGCPAEVQEPGLRARVEIDLESVIVLPFDVQPTWYPHDRRCAVGFALLARGFVLGRIPVVRGLLPLVVERDTGSVALGRSHHAIKPVFGHQGNPVAGDIDGSLRPRNCWSHRRATASAASTAFALPSAATSALRE